MEEGVCTEGAGIIMVGLALHGVLSSFAGREWRMYLHVNSSMGTLYSVQILNTPSADAVAPHTQHGYDH